MCAKKLVENVKPDKTVVELNKFQTVAPEEKDETAILNEIFRLIEMMPEGPAKKELNNSCCRASNSIIKEFLEKNPR